MCILFNVNSSLFFFAPAFSSETEALWSFCCMIILGFADKMHAYNHKNGSPHFVSFHVIVYSFVTMICMQSYFWKQTVVKMDNDMNVKINRKVFRLVDIHARVCWVMSVKWKWKKAPPALNTYAHIPPGSRWSFMTVIQRCIMHAAAAHMMSIKLDLI